MIYVQWEKIPKNGNCGLRFTARCGRISKKGPEVLLKQDSKSVISNLGNAELSRGYLHRS